MSPKESIGLALARGFIVFIMPAVHSVMMYSNDIVKAGGLGIVLGFLAEQPGAQLFMLQMGLFIGMSKQKTLRAILKRFVILLAGGYLLNLLRLVLPYWWGGIPSAFLVHNDISGNEYTALYLFLIGDILQFAALGYLCCHIINCYLNSIYLRIALLLLLVIITPVVWALQSDNAVLQFIVELFNGLPPKVFFPFFPWICYPLAGLIISQIWRQSKRFKISLWLVIAFGLIITGLAISSIEPLEWNTNFYRLGPGGTLFHLGAVIIAVCVFIVIASYFKTENIIIKFLLFLSRNITVVYVIQWLIVCWALPLFGYHNLHIYETCLAIVINTFLTIFFSFLYVKYSKQWKPTMI